MRFYARTKTMIAMAVGVTAIAGVAFFYLSKAEIWVLQVYEPFEHAGFSRPFEEEADCRSEVARWDAEARQLKAAGRGNIAPTARCILVSKRRFWPE